MGCTFTERVRHWILWLKHQVPALMSWCLTTLLLWCRSSSTGRSTWWWGDTCVRTCVALTYCVATQVAWNYLDLFPCHYEVHARTLQCSMPCLIVAMNPQVWCPKHACMVNGSLCLSLAHLGAIMPTRICIVCACGPFCVCMYMHAMLIHICTHGCDHAGTYMQNKVGACPHVHA